MNADNQNQITLPVFDTHGQSAGFETLLVECIAPSRYRLIHSPGFVEGLAADDVVELSSEVERGYSVVERGGYICVWFFFPDKDQNRSPEAEQLCKDVETIGGWLDGGATYLLIFTIPISTGFAQIKSMFDAVLEQFPGSEWLYGNVYDPHDGITPLNWWAGS